MKPIEDTHEIEARRKMRSLRQSESVGVRVFPFVEFRDRDCWRSIETDRGELFHHIGYLLLEGREKEGYVLFPKQWK